MSKPRIAVYKFASCDGCQLSLLDCEDELLQVADVIHIAFFPEATSRMESGPFDVVLVEGSITTNHDLHSIQKIRENAKFLMTIGACATSGGIQALKNFASVKDYTKIVYPHPEYIQSLSTSKAISTYVKVDYELYGCPINKVQLLEVINALINQRKPQIPSHSVCVECKASGKVCVMVSQGIPCLGPVTHAGCGALCPRFQRGCYGCFGSKENTNPDSLYKWFLQPLKLPADKINPLFLSYHCDRVENQSIRKKAGYEHQ